MTATLSADLRFANGPLGGPDEQRAAVVALESLVASRQEALRKFGRHYAGCPLGPAHLQFNGGSSACTCGFADAIQEGK